MSLLKVIFYSFEGVAALAAISLLFVKNIFHAALALLMCLLAIAALFILSAAEFPGVSQLLIYAGGIVVLVIFGIMLTHKSATKSEAIKNNNTLGAVFIGAGALFLLINFASKSMFVVRAVPKPPEQFNSIETIGIELLTDYVLPFELTGILLLVVLAGAATIAGYKSKKT
jgi:NADH:ubiquinone oxidoreductase subunit 6 (subunit J)